MSAEPTVTAVTSLPEHPILKLTEVAQFLRISRSKAHAMARTGELPTFRLGRLVRVRRTDLMKWVNQLQ